MDKKFIACGVGNAIVDVTVKVSFHDLVLLGLNKDESCLIDLDKKNKIKQFIKDDIEVDYYCLQETDNHFYKVTDIFEKLQQIKEDQLDKFLAEFLNT